MVSRLVSIALLVLVLSAGSVAPAAQADDLFQCPIASARATTDDGTVLQNQVPATVVAPGSTITVALTFDTSYGLCPAGVQSAAFAPDGRPLDRPWSDGGGLTYSARIPADLRGGVDQRLVIATREELGAAPLFTIAFRTAATGSENGSFTDMGPGRVIDGRLVLCSDHPEVCAPHVGTTAPDVPPAAAPAPAPAPTADSAAGTAPAEVTAQTPLADATPSAESVPAPPAEVAPTGTIDTATNAGVAEAPGWLWAGLGIAAVLGVVIVGGVRALRHRDHLARMRRMADRE